MPRKKRKPASKPKQQAKSALREQPESRVPKFEIGVKGDEFDLKFTRAVAEKTSGADGLLRDLSRETKRSGFDLLSVAVSVLALLFMSLSFALFSRSEGLPHFSASALASGKFTAEFSDYYKNTLPFRETLEKLGAFLGFCDPPEPQPQPEPEDRPPENIPAASTVTETEAPVTEPPTVSTEAPVSAPISEPTEPEIPETTTMFANATVNIRMAPDADSMIMGYFASGEAVEVIEIAEDGWAKIYYNGMTAYVFAEYLGEEPAVSTRRHRTTTAEPETEPSTEPSTEPEPEETSQPETSEEETTSSRRVTMDPDFSLYVSRRERSSATEPPEE